MLETTLSNSGPSIHVPLALMNMTRMEREEKWLQYEHFTEKVSNVMVALDNERIAIGAALGFAFDGIAEEFCASYGAKIGPLPQVAAQIVRLRNGGPLGPVTPVTRYLTEDVPFGLRFWAIAGSLVDVPTPLTNACITMAELALGDDIARNSTLLDMVSTYDCSKEDLLNFAAGR